ncbi:MAG: Mut7-C RNAse domain-containing protein [bacterium]|nr:Mut7-C RNAse domain-containing protein [bacterium]
MRFLADNNLGRLLRLAGFGTDEDPDHDYHRMTGDCLKNNSVLRTRDSKLIHR